MVKSICNSYSILDTGGGKKKDFPRIDEDFLLLSGNFYDERKRAVALIDK